MRNKKVRKALQSKNSIDVKKYFKILMLAQKYEHIEKYIPTTNGYLNMTLKMVKEDPNILKEILLLHK